MKKKIKWIGILLGSILLLVGGYFLGKQLIWNYKVVTILVACATL